ncbi:NUDIX hydrolase [Nocardioides nanhaiensis]|uniref:NUDIX hydrolase n=1 Tax=Nocardioides nanhaiensis TaxID=1476871 RepID=A0ABP8W4K3_9ACTN
MSLHADALTTLRDWEAPDDEQEALRRRYLTHLERHPDGMLRAGRPDHVTASTLVLDAAGTSVLLTLHAKSGRWFQVGGHTEPEDATLAGAALREALEETGIARADLALDPVPLLLDAHHVPFCGPGENVHHLDVMFVAHAAASAAPSISEESLDLAWWPVDGLPDAELAPFVARALARRRHAGQAGSASGAAGSSSDGGGSSRAAADQPSR